MREFMSYVLQSFREATGWNGDHSYSELNRTAEGARGDVAALSTPARIETLLTRCALA